MFGIDTIGILPFDIKSRGYLSYAALLIAAVPFGVLLKRMNCKLHHTKKWSEKTYYKDGIPLLLDIIENIEIVVHIYQGDMGNCTDLHVKPWAVRYS